MSDTSTTTNPTRTVTTGDILPLDQPLIAGELLGIHPSYRLDCRNFLQWFQLVKTLLKGQGKSSHLSANPPAANDPNFNTWDVGDSRIMSWLWSLMQPEISKNFMFLNTVREVWETMQPTYSQVRDASVIFVVKTKINGTKQGHAIVSEYYNLMRGLWLELD